MQAPNEQLRRSLGLPLLVLYGVGTTVGAGIFALIGEISGLAGPFAPLSFLIAGLIAAATGLSYALLSPIFPKAAGEVAYTDYALGRLVARAVGFAILAAAIISSAVIALAFAGYLGEIIGLPRPILAIGLIGLLAALAAWGVRQSVIFVSIVTLSEALTLGIIIIYGMPYLTAENMSALIALPTPSAWNGIFAGAFLAFFAFIGFEDMVNMAEETHNPEKTLPRAILLTIIITIAIYALIAILASAIPGHEIIQNHEAPLAALFELASGLNPQPIAAMAAIAMINGILVQIIMASRLIYGMAGRGLLPAGLAKINPHTQTPLRATAFVALCIIFLASGFPLASLAGATSSLTLLIFTMINLSLWRMGGFANAPRLIAKWRYWGLFAAALSLILLAIELKG